MKLPRPISAARVIRKEFGAEPMPTMNTRERPRRPAMRVEQLLLVADRTVGEEYHLPERIGICGPRVGQRRAHRRHHLGAAARLQCRHEVLGPRNILRIGRHAVGNSASMGVVEADDIEAV